MTDGAPLPTLAYVRCPFPDCGKPGQPGAINAHELTGSVRLKCRRCRRVFWADSAKDTCPTLYPLTFEQVIAKLGAARVSPTAWSDNIKVKLTAADN